MPTLYILSGISGSGKSTYVKDNLIFADHFSADHYFMDKGEYKFNPEHLPAAHSSCLRKALTSLQEGYLDGNDIVIDNTNTSVAEIAPYAALALAYGYELQILSFTCNVADAYNRNVHNVPLEAIQGQQARLATLKDSLPSWWPIEDAKV